MTMNLYSQIGRQNIRQRQQPMPAMGAQPSPSGQLGVTAAGMIGGPPQLTAQQAGGVPHRSMYAPRPQAPMGSLNPSMFSQYRPQPSYPAGPYSPFGIPFGPSGEDPGQVLNPWWLSPFQQLGPRY